MEMRRLGTAAGGPRVAPIGLGCSAMSGAYGPADEKESLATIHAAIDAGVTLLDTADFYGMGHNEWLIRQALRAGAREKVVLSVNFSAVNGRACALGCVHTSSRSRLSSTTGRSRVASP